MNCSQIDLIFTKKRRNFNIIVAPDLFGFGLCPSNRIIYFLFSQENLFSDTRVKNKMIFCVFSITRDNEWGLISDRRLTDTDHFAHCV